MCFKACFALLSLLLQVQIVAAVMDVDEVRGRLEKMGADEVWGEAVFADGRVRSFRVGVVGPRAEDQLHRGLVHGVVVEPHNRNECSNCVDFRK